jgi:hypothetical protein
MRRVASVPETRLANRSSTFSSNTLTDYGSVTGKSPRVRKSQGRCPWPVCRRTETLLRRIADRLRVERTLLGGQFQGRGYGGCVLLPVEGIEPGVQPLGGRK